MIALHTGCDFFEFPPKKYGHDIPFLKREAPNVTYI